MLWPIWGFRYELAQNATTLWEKFEGTGGTHNHIMFGTQSAWYFRNLAGIQRRRVDRATFKGSAWASLRLKPTVSCEYLRPDLNLTRVNASLETPAGRVVSSWQLWRCPTISHPPVPWPGPPGAAATCALVLEKDKHQTNTTGIALLGCGAGEVIDRVTFADFGVPTGSCSDGFTPGKCSAANATAKVAAICVGDQSCSVPVNVHTFGDPCPLTPKRLAVKVACRAAPSPPSPPPPPPPVGPRKFTWDISIPTAATAVVELPLLAAAPDKVSITVDGRSLWQKGAFMPGAPGVSAGAAHNGTVVLSVGSGDYSFVLEDA